MDPLGKEGDLWQVKFGFMHGMHASDGAVQIVDRDGMHGGMDVADW